MSEYELPDYSKVKVYQTPQMIEDGVPSPEKWKGLELARKVGRNGFTFDTLLEDSKMLIGFECSGFSTKLTPYTEFDAWSTREHILTHGDDNPLYTDPEYGKKTKYGCMLVYPTLLHRVKYGMTHGIADWGPNPISSLVSGLSWDYYDVVRVNSRFRSSMKMKDVVEKKGRTGRLILYLTETSFWNQNDDLVAGGGGIYILVGKSGEEAKMAEEAERKGEGMSKTMLYERPTYKYSDDEIKKIVMDIDNEERRGALPRYWEDVNVEDKFTPVVKPSFRLYELTKGHGWEHGPGRGANFVPTVIPRPTKNPMTGWPYEHFGDHHHDFNLCNRRGLPGPFDHGIQRMTMSAHLLSNWMGDDGFIRRDFMQVRKPCYYGDTLWYLGEVVAKYKDKVRGEVEGKYKEIEYGAIDISFNATNQIGEITIPGKATIYLPSRELGEVQLPVPIPTKEDWKLVTKRDAKDFIEEIRSGETIFPDLPRFLGIEEE